MKTYSLNELKESRIMFDKKPPRFMFYIVGTVLIAIIGLTIFANYSIKTYVVKASGLVSSINKYNIMTAVQGKVANVYIKEGIIVKKNDLLFSIDDTQITLQIAQSESQMEYLIRKVDLYNSAIKNIQNGTNIFNNSNDEAELFNLVLSYFVQLKQYDVNESDFKSLGYNDEQIASTKTQSLQKKDALKYQTITSLGGQKAQYELELNKLQTQKDSLLKSLEGYKVMAQNDGIVHLSVPIKPDTVLQAGTLIGSITSTNTNEDIIIDAAISASDRAKINVGDSTEIAISGVMQSEYGVLQGEVVSIDNDSTINNEKGTVYFNIKIKPKDTELVSKNKKAINISYGMIAETRIKYDETTWLNWGIEQIGVKLR